MLVSRLLMSHSCAVRFENQVLFVSGGASGIGLATAERVVADGGPAAIVDLDLERAEVAAAGLPGGIGLAANVADDAAVAAAVSAAVERLVESTSSLPPPVAPSSVRSRSGTPRVSTGC